MNQFSTTPLINCSLAQFAWLEGAWRGTVGEDQIDEYWSGQGGGTLMGMFRWLRAGTLRFYEFTTLALEDNEVIFRIKHFHPGLVGWEEKERSVEFVLVQIDGKEAIFLQRHVSDAPWMVYRGEGQDVLISYFQRHGKDVAEQDQFRYLRQHF